jgi:hypothetical protein
VMSHGPPVMPVYGGATVPLPAAPIPPTLNPNSDRMPPISSAVLSGSR